MKNKISLLFLSLMLLYTSPAYCQITFTSKAVPTARLAAYLPFYTITSISDANADGTGTIGEVISIHGTGFLNTMTVFIGKKYGVAAQATIVNQTATKIDAIVPTGIETGTAVDVVVRYNSAKVKKPYPVNRLLAYVTDTRTVGLQILSADTMTPWKPALDFDALGLTDGDGLNTKPLDLVIKSRGDQAYIVMKKRLYPLDLINGTVNVAGAINFTDSSAIRGFLTPQDDYLLTLSINTFFSSTTSRIGPLPTGTVSSITSLIFLDDLAITPDQSSAYITHDIDKVSRLTITPTYAVATTVQPSTAGGQLTQVALNPNANNSFIGRTLSGNDQILVLDLPAMTTSTISPLNVPGKVSALALTYPTGQYVLVGDCFNNQVHRIQVSNGAAVTLNVSDCPRLLSLPADGKYAYIGRPTGGFMPPPTFVSKWDVAQNTLVGTYQESNAILVGVAVQQ